MVPDVLFEYRASGAHLSEPRLLSPLRSSALQYSPLRSGRRAHMLFMEEAVSLKIYERERTGRELRAKLVTRLLFSTVGVAWPGSLSLDSFGMRSEVLNFSAGDFPMMGLGLSGVRVMVESENDLGENTAPAPSNSIGPQPISVSLIVDVFENFGRCGVLLASVFTRGHNLFPVSRRYSTR